MFKYLYVSYSNAVIIVRFIFQTEALKLFWKSLLLTPLSKSVKISRDFGCGFQFLSMKLENS